MGAASAANVEPQTWGRRSARASGDDRERAILATAERLLEERPLGEISVDDLARGAGISRPTFYFYFASKDAVVLTIIDRLVASVAGAREQALAALAEEPRAALRQVLEAYFAAFSARRAVVLAAAQLRATSAEARELWAQVTEGWVADVTAIIESERARGAVPQGLPARDLAIALVLMNERVQYATLAQESPSIGPGAVIDTLVDVWLRAVYGED